MPDFSTSVDIEPWEYVSECSGRDIEDLIESYRAGCGGKTADSKPTCRRISK